MTTWQIRSARFFLGRFRSVNAPHGSPVFEIEFCRKNVIRDPPFSSVAIRLDSSLFSFSAGRFVESWEYRRTFADASLDHAPNRLTYLYMYTACISGLEGTKEINVPRLQERAALPAVPRVTCGVSSKSQWLRRFAPRFQCNFYAKPRQ